MLICFNGILVLIVVANEKENFVYGERLVHLSSVHHSDDVRIYHKEIKSLLKYGANVSFVVPVKRGSESGVIVEVSFPETRICRMTKTMYSIFIASLKERAVLYHFHDPELIIVALLLKFLGKKIIYDVHEDLPRQILNKHWLPRWSRWFLSACAEVAERTSTVFCDGIITATPTIARRFPAKKTQVVCNYPDPNEFSTIDLSNYQLRDYDAIYIGGLARVRGIYEMVVALEKLDDRFQLTMAGNFTDKCLEGPVRSLNTWGRVNFKGWQSRLQIVELLGRSRVGLVLLHPIDNYLDSYPIKLFEYMAAGIPVIASNFPLWSKIVNDAECGLLVDPLDVDAIAKAITWIFDNPDKAEVMGQNGRNAVMEKYNWRHEEHKLNSFYKMILNI